MDRMKKKSFKAQKMKGKSNLGKNLLFYIIIGTLLAASFIGLQMETGKYKKEVQIVSFKNDIGGKVIEEADLAVYKLPEKAVKPGMVPWKDRAEIVIDKYMTMQIRKETPIYEDMLSDSPQTRHKYLYELAPNEELLTFQYDNLKAAGRIPRPGDRFRIRGSYKLSDDEIKRLQEKSASLAGQGGTTGTSGTATGSSSTEVGFANQPAGSVSSVTATQGQPNTYTKGIKDADGNVIVAGATDTETIIGDIKTDVVFDVVIVSDMLNQKGDSIFEINKALETLPRAKQEELMAEDGFKTSLTPHSLLLIVKSEQVQKYVEYNAGQDVMYTLTLLTRDKSLMEDDIRSGGSIVDGIPSATPEGGLDN